MREFTSSLKTGANESDTSSLSTYAFLYGTIPTAPAVFVFSNLYQLEMDLVSFLTIFNITTTSCKMYFVFCNVNWSSGEDE